MTLDGRPLQEAAIIFVPLDVRRQKSGGAIVAGRYALAADVGLLPGKYRVEIADNPPLGSATATLPTIQESRTPAPRRKLPLKYMHDSPLRCEIGETDSAAEPREFDFDLKSEPTTK